MDRQNIVCRFLKDERGATIVEFALVSTMFFMIFLGIIEYGLIMFTRIAIESATQQVSRSSAIDAKAGCSDRVCAIKTLIAQKTAGIINPNNVLIASNVVGSNYTQPYPPDPDVCLVNYPADPYPATCGGTYIDNNGTPGYQSGTSVNAGGADDVVQIRVYYTWQVMFPLLKPFFPNGAVPITATTVVKNEPFN